MSDIKPAILITGAGRGLGLELVRSYSRRGCPVVATYRGEACPEPLRTALDAVEHSSALPLDVSNEKSIVALGAALEKLKLRLEVVINNAGANRVAPADTSTGEMEEFIHLFKTNAAGPYMLSLKQHGYIAPAAKIICISSDRASLTAAMACDSAPYAMSKVALNMAVRKLARERLDSSGLAVAIHPGWVRTDMGGPKALVDAEVAAERLVHLIDLLRPEHNGLFLDADGGALAW